MLKVSTCVTDLTFVEKITFMDVTNVTQNPIEALLESILRRIFSALKADNYETS